MNRITDMIQTHPRQPQVQVDLTKLAACIEECGCQGKAPLVEVVVSREKLKAT